MMQKRTKATGIFKSLFIVMLILFILGSVLYFPLKLSIVEAERQGTLPQLLGNTFIPYLPEEKSPYSQIEAGSLIFFEATTSKSVQEGLIVLYPTPDTGSAKNIVFPGYSMGMVATMNETEDVGSTYSIVIVNDPDLALETISADSVIGVGSTTMKRMAGVFNFVVSTKGLVLLVSLPFILFVIFLLLFLFFRTKKTKNIAVSDDHDEINSLEEAVPNALQNLSVDQRLVQCEPSSLLALETPSADPDLTAIKNDDLLQKETVSVQEDTQVTTTVASVDYDAEKLQPDLTYTVQAESNDGKQAGEASSLELTPDFTKSIDLEENAMERPQDFFTELNQIKQQPYVQSNDSILDEEAFLAKIEEDLNQIENDTYESVAASSRNVAEARDVINHDDTITFLVKEDEIDVKFNNLISKNIDIEYHQDGSGFSIKTKKYQADITVVVSEN